MDNKILSIDNLGKPSDPKYKKWADVALYMLMAELPIVAILPVSDNTKLWITIGLTQATVIVKAISKFTIDPNYVDSDIEQDTATN